MDIDQSSHNPYGFDDQYVTYQSHNEGIDEDQTSTPRSHNNRGHSRRDRSGLYFTNSRSNLLLTLYSLNWFCIIVQA